jgi:predicted RNA polymerase sigma factor
MSSAASSALTGIKAIESLTREDRGRILSALIARLRNFSLAEEALQDATLSAVSHWGRSGVPSNPQGWLLQVALRKAIDRMRQDKSLQRVASDFSVFNGGESAEADDDTFPDERLRLIFTCCHPAIETKSRIALTLRTVGGLSTAEIAHAFLDQEATMGQRLSRAKAKIAAASIPYVVPEPEDWPERLNAVLSVIYLIFNAGYSVGPTAGRDLAEEAIWLARTLDTLCPADPEIEGLLALLLFTNARRKARLDADGVTVALMQQDRTLWDQHAIDEGTALTERALSRGKPGAYQIKAAIAACHCEGDAPDWPQIALLYDALLTYEATDVVRLNRAVAAAEAGALDFALAELARLEPTLSSYQPFYAAQAELLARYGQTEAAMHAYDRAITLASSPADATLLARRRNALGP